jgi:hypothetical protein
MNNAILTPEFRLSFPVLFNASADQNGRVNFRMEMLFPKTIRMSDLAEMKALYNATVLQKWIVGGDDYRKFEAAFINGDKKKQPERQKHWILRASSGEKYPPRLIRPDRTRATEADIYAGCYCRAILTAFPYEPVDPKTGRVISRGVSFNIDTVQKTRDGDPFGNTVLSEEERDQLLGDMPLDENLSALLGE